jgi:DNA-binding MarR family transcriptional regulator
MNSSCPLHGIFFQMMKQSRTDLDRWLRKIKSGITSLQYGVLRSIAKKDLAFNELARHMLLRPPSILPAVDGLERQRYIVRRGDSKDRRKVHLVITPKGKKLLARVASFHHSDSLTRAFKKMSVAKQNQLVGLLTELTGSISKSKKLR